MFFFCLQHFRISSTAFNQFYFCLQHFCLASLRCTSLLPFHYHCPTHLFLLSEPLPCFHLQPFLIQSSVIIGWLCWGPNLVSWSPDSKWLCHGHSPRNPSSSAYELCHGLISKNQSQVTNYPPREPITPHHLLPITVHHTSHSNPPSQMGKAFWR